MIRYKNKAPVIKAHRRSNGHQQDHQCTWWVIVDHGKSYDAFRCRTFVKRIGPMDRLGVAQVDGDGVLQLVPTLKCFLPINRHHPQRKWATIIFFWKSWINACLQEANILISEVMLYIYIMMAGQQVQRWKKVVSRRLWDNHPNEDSTEISQHDILWWLTVLKIDLDLVEWLHVQGILKCTLMEMLFFEAWQHCTHS